ncbi:MAG: sigma-70 family RNA polymerase sigma factor [Archangium sp.]|nr:sigma-70 family RNA polymerase sigma factor [Archangium sp.]MBM4784207.1 sigma-70 family RNA polymerase sigma factor [Archangiaceae bacterium]
MTGTRVGDQLESAVGRPTFDELYRQHALTVARWAARLGKPWLDPEDVTHDVFLKVQRSLPTLDALADAEAWLYAITVNVVRTRRRVERFRRWFQRPETEGQRVPATSASAVEHLERRDAERLVLDAMQTLSDRDREVLVLFELEGRSGQEVSRLMGAPVDRIWVWLFRARQRFARAVEALERSSP